MIKPLLQNIVVAVNGSQASIHASMYGILMCRLYHCKMKAVFVVDTDTINVLTTFRFLMSSESTAFEDKLTQDGQKYLDHVAKLAKSKGVNIETELKHGAVWSGVVDTAIDFNAQMILLGGNAHYDTNQLHHDAVSTANSEIIGSALCSVLVVREPQIEQIFKMA